MEQKIKLPRHIKKIEYTDRLPLGMTVKEKEIMYVGVTKEYLKKIKKEGEDK